MSIFNLFKSQLSAVIEWTDQDNSILWYKHPSERNEIINASKLIVAPGQGAVLIYEGQVKDIIVDEGIYNLKTDNHPFLTTLANLRQNFNSEHKLYIYFFRTAAILNQNWGTASAVKYMDPIYNIPVELGANGTFSYKITNAAHFYSEVVTNVEKVNSYYIQDIVNNAIPQEIISTLAKAQLSYTQIDAQLQALSLTIKEQINSTFSGLGLDIIDFKIIGTQFDSKTIERIGGIADITSQNQAAAQAGLSFTDLEKLRALRDAAKNEGGIAGVGAQFGAGIEIGKQFELTQDQIKDDITASGEDYLTKLQKINILFQEGILTEEEFNTLKKQIIAKI